MKKYLIAVCFITGFTGVAAAQTARKKAPAAVKMEKAKPSTEASGTSKTLKKEAIGAGQTTLIKASRETAAGPLKKDGTTDSRFIKTKKKKG
jgi:hypothetical protein